MLPYQLPATDGLIVADYQTISLITAAATSTGIVTASSLPVDPGKDYAWLVDAMVVQNTSTVATALSVFFGPPGDTSARDLVAGTTAGNLDFDDVAGVGLLVQASEAITFQWAGCSISAIGTARVQYRILRMEPTS